MKITITAFAEVGSHGGIFEFIEGPVAERCPNLLHIYSEFNHGLVPVTITYDFPTNDDNNERKPNQ